ncbi:MAG: ABC transporter permease [Euzebya sp.]
MITRLLLRRLLQSVLVFLGATFIVYCMVWLLPGDEIRALFGFQRPDAATVAELRAAYHLDEPFLQQYGRYLLDFLQGDMGPFYSTNVFGDLVQRDVVNRIVLDSLPRTLRIVSVSIVIQLLVAIPGGVALGRRHGTGGDRGVLVMGVIGVAIPGFVFAAIVRPFAVDIFGGSFLEAQGWTRAVLPGLVAAIVPAALITRVLRLRAQELAHEPWVTTMRGCGIKEDRIAWWYGGRQVLITGVTLVAAEIGPTLAGLLVVEQVFQIRGLGSVLLAAARNQQGPLVTGAVTSFIAVTVIATLIADVLVLMLDPRLSHTLPRDD